MATLSIQQIDRSGLSPTYASAASGGDEFPHDPNAFIHVKNGDATSVTVTVVSQYSSNPQGLASTDLTVTVPGNEERFIGPFSETAFADADGNVQLTYDDVSSVTLGVFTQR